MQQIRVGRLSHCICLNGLSLVLGFSTKFSSDLCFLQSGSKLDLGPADVHLADLLVACKHRCLDRLLDLQYELQAEPVVFMRDRTNQASTPHMQHIGRGTVAYQVV